MRTTAHILTISIVIATAGPPAAAQDAESFEVASIRRNLSRTQLGSGLAGPQPGGRFIAREATLHRLVAYAYDVLEVEGGPEWARSDRYDVNARGAGRSQDDIRRMLRTLLADRFKLAVHRESREMPVYALTIARADRRLGPQLRPSDAKCADEARNFFPGATGFPPPCGDFRLGAGALVARGVTMASLAKLLAGRAGRPGLDRTALSGFYDLNLEWSSDPGLQVAPPDTAGAGAPKAEGVSFFTALQEQLGFRLEAGRGQVEVIVIDRAEPPTPD